MRLWDLESDQFSVVSVCRKVGQFLSRFGQLGRQVVGLRTVSFHIVQFPLFSIDRVLFFPYQ